MKRKLIPAFLIGTLVGSVVATIGFFAAKEHNSKTVNLLEDDSDILSSKVIDALISKVDAEYSEIEEQAHTNDIGQEIKHTLTVSDIDDIDPTIVIDEFIKHEIINELLYKQNFDEINLQDEVDKFDSSVFDFSDDVEEVSLEEVNLYHNDDKVEDYKKRTLDELDKICEQLVEKII